MGRFALTAQAASLLGRVFQHLAGRKKDPGYAEQEAVLLDGALATLTVVAAEEGRSRGIGVCTPSVLCFRYMSPAIIFRFDSILEEVYEDVADASSSARILLGLHGDTSNNDNSDASFSSAEENIIRSGIAADMIRLCQWSISDKGLQLDDEISPFPLHAAYHTAVAYIEMFSRGSGKECRENLETVKEMFRLYEPRWKVAGESSGWMWSGMMLILG